MAVTLAQAQWVSGNQTAGPSAGSLHHGRAPPPLPITLPHWCGGRRGLQSGEQAGPEAAAVSGCRAAHVSQMHVLRVRAWTVPRQVWSDLRPTFPPGGGRVPLLSPLPKWRSRFFSSCSESSSRTRHRSPQLRQRTASRDSRNLEEAARAPERLLRSAVARLKSRDGGGGGTWGPPQPPGRADAHQGRARAVHVCVFRLSAEVCLA